MHYSYMYDGLKYSQVSLKWPGLILPASCPSVNRVYKQMIHFTCIYYSHVIMCVNMHTIKVETLEATSTESL